MSHRGVRGLLYTMAQLLGDVSAIHMTLAVSLGAPFWFDLLNKLVNLRNSGKPPEKDKEDEQTEKKQSSGPPDV